MMACQLATMTQARSGMAPAGQRGWRHPGIACLAGRGDVEGTLQLNSDWFGPRGKQQLQLLGVCLVASMEWIGT